MKLKCIEGVSFGRWTIVRKPVGNMIECLCECGTTKMVYKSNLTTGKSLSCGCLSKEVVSKRMSTHGESETKLYGVWLTMRNRCRLKTSKSYKDYGARGVRVCDEWESSFESFRDWSLINGYREGLTIERKNNSDGYSPINCKWAGREEQGNNKRNNHWLKVNGEEHTLAQWSRIYGISRKTIASRIKAGWVEPKLFTSPETGNNQYTHYKGGN